MTIGQVVDTGVNWRRFQLARRFSKVLFQQQNRGTLYIHAGLHKTGTTAIQSALREAGLLYPSHRRDFRSQSRLREILRQAQAKTLVVSSEHFLGEMLGFYGSASERLSWLAENFKALVLVVYARAPLEWHESAFSQLIQQGSVISEDEYVYQVMRSPMTDFRRLANSVAQINRAHSAGSVRHSVSVVRDYSEVLGCQLPEVGTPNKSLNPLALEILKRHHFDEASPHSVLRKRLAGWNPVPKAELSVFSEETQRYFQNKWSEWIEAAEMLSAHQKVPESWMDSSSNQIRRFAGEVLSLEHLESARVWLANEEQRDDAEQKLFVD